MEIRTGNPRLVHAPPGTILAVLKEENGPRTLTIELEVMFATLIYWEIENIEPPKPMIFKFVLECMRSLVTDIEKIVIYDLVDRAYYSYVVIKDNRENRTYNLDLHVTNALALAVAAKCPIFVTEEVFNKQDSYRKELGEENIRNIFNNIDPAKSVKH